MNNYLNNTLTNLHLQDFLKEKGLDVSGTCKLYKKHKGENK